MQNHVKVLVTVEEFFFVIRPKLNIFFLLSSLCQGYLGCICNWIDFQGIAWERIYTILENSDAYIVVKVLYH